MENRSNSLVSRPHQVGSSKTKRHKDSVCSTFHQVGSKTKRLSIPTAGCVIGMGNIELWYQLVHCKECTLLSREDENSRNQ